MANKYLKEIWNNPVFQKEAKKLQNTSPLPKNVFGKSYQELMKDGRKDREKSKNDVQNKFKWTGVIRCLMDNINQADMVFAFDVEYKGKKQGENPELNQKADLYVYGKKVPVGATLVQDERSHWSIEK